jgi:hypothetical protein
MNDTIYNLRHVELDPALAAKLFPFINSYRPHDPAPTWQELKAEGLEKVEEESLMDVVMDQREFEKESAEAR